MAVTLPLVSGCSVVLRERWDAARAVDDMRTYGVTYTGGATVFIQELADAVEAAGLDVAPALVWLQPRRQRDPARRGGAGRGASGSGPGAPYGMTECPTVSASLGDDGPDVRCLTDGRILPGVEVRVVDADGRDVAPRRRGRVPRARAAARARLPRPAAHRRRLRRRRLVPQRRPRRRRRPQLHPGDRPHQGRHQPRRREAVGPGDRRPVAPPPRRQRRRGGRGAAPASGRGAGRVRDRPRTGSRSTTPRWRSSSRRRASPRRRSRVSWWRSTTCPAPPAARSRSTSSSSSSRPLTRRLHEHLEVRRAHVTVNFEMFAAGGVRRAGRASGW